MYVFFPLQMIGNPICIQENVLNFERNTFKRIWLVSLWLINKISQPFNKMAKKGKYNNLFCLFFNKENNMANLGRKLSPGADSWSKPAGGPVTSLQAGNRHLNYNTYKTPLVSKGLASHKIRQSGFCEWMCCGNVQLCRPLTPGHLQMTMSTL